MLLRRLGDLVTENAERLARLEVADSGKLYREMIGQLGGWYHSYAGLADKIEGRQIPAPNPNYLVYTRCEPVGTAWRGGVDEGRAPRPPGGRPAARRHGVGQRVPADRGFT